MVEAHRCLNIPLRKVDSIATLSSTDNPYLGP
jgi:hypothetical protein